MIVVLMGDSGSGREVEVMEVEVVVCSLPKRDIQEVLRLPPTNKSLRCAAAKADLEEGMRE